MADKIEEVKKILKYFRELDEIDDCSYQAGINAERNLNETATKICQLFEPKPDEGRLLTEKALGDIEWNETPSVSDRYNADFSFIDDYPKEVRRIIELQDAKTASIKDAEIREITEPSNELLEVGRKAIEDVLIEWRDNRLSEFPRGNGLVVREKDGRDSSIIRFGPETALRIGIKAMWQALKEKGGG